MRKTEEMLASTLAERLKVSGRAAQEYFNEAAEVIVFGSMSAGLDRPTSDMDVLCMGTHDRKFKSDLLDLIVVPSVVTKTRSWRQSELATHVACYGTWIKGKPSWTSDIGVGEHAVKEKRRRILAFISALHGSWFRLEECFHVKYSIKLRREIQRLLLLERDVPVPPTIILDSSWASVSISPSQVLERLQDFGSKTSSTFLDDLVFRFNAHFQVNRSTDFQ